MKNISYKTVTVNKPDNISLRLVKAAIDELGKDYCCSIDAIIQFIDKHKGKLVDIENQSFQLSWIIYPNIHEHLAPKGFEGYIPAIGTEIVIQKRRYIIHKHVMYYEDDGTAILSIRAKELERF